MGTEEIPAKEKRNEEEALLSPELRALGIAGQEPCRLSAAQAWLMLNYLQSAFDIVRLVDAATNRQFFLNNAGEAAEEPYRCYAVWKRGERCENCISAKVFSTRGRAAKFEFVGGDVYHVLAKYLEVEGVPYSLELVSRITDETLFGAYGRSELVRSISNYNRKLYCDPLTGARNRQYYAEQLKEMRGDFAVAMMDADDFKSINDTYGHQAGDLALKAIAKTALACMRGSDCCVRYGGDEFLLLFREIPFDRFAARMEEIRLAVLGVTLQEYPEIRLSVSIGGTYGTGGMPELIRLADQMLYQSKATGRSAVQRYAGPPREL